MRGHQSRKDTRNEILKQASPEQKAEVLTEPIALFGGTRSGAVIHPEPTAPSQPLFGQNLKITIRKNYDELKKY